MFNESQERYLIGRLRHAEELLSQGLDELDPERGGGLFRHKLADAAPSQRRVLHDHLAQLRFCMRRFMQAQSLQDAGEPISALWSLQVAVSFALVAIEEMRPRYLKGYGEVDPESARAAELFVVEAQTLLKRISGYLASGTGGDLAARAAQLDGTREEGALLRELERIISAHGIVELRATLQDLIERMSKPRLEIAVFGRVNAGKSSLLNWWLGAALLPTGVTPITAVPTRITHGPAQVSVTLAAGRTIRIPMEELPAYVAEAGNPNNSKGVLEVSIHTPNERLPEGIVLVDTPGLGSLAASGAIQTLQYLPRCDLGVLLLEAGAPITEEDLNVTRALLDSGCEVLPTLSKGDRLAESDLSEALAYTERALHDQLGRQLSVSVISTVAPHAALASKWFTDCVQTRLAHVREEAARSLRRKIGVLRETVVTVLEARQASTAVAAGADLSGTAAWNDRVARARALIDSTRSDVVRIAEEVSAHLDALLASGARELERCWHEHQDSSTTDTRVRAAVMAHVRRLSGRVAQTFDELRGHLEEVAGEAAGRPAHESLPAPRGLPAGELSWAGRAGGFRRPRGPLGYGAPLRILARKRLESEIRATLSQQLAVYGEALRLWAERYLSELSAQFEAIVARYEGLQRIGASRTGSIDEREDLAADLRRLQHWPQGGVTTAPPGGNKSGSRG